MAILKVPMGRTNPIVGQVTGVNLSEGKFGVQYAVDFANGDVVYLNKGPTEQQIARLSLTEPTELIGKTVSIWKKPMPDDPSGTKGYLNIEFSTGGVAAAYRADDHVGRDLRVSGVPMATRAKDFDAVKDKYQETLGAAYGIVKDLGETFDLPVNTEHVLSVAACLYIERNKAGV